jgi:hypothetical protein
MLKATGLSGPLTQSIVNGSDLSAMTGGVDAATVNRALSARLDQVTSRVRLEATNGRISLEIPGSREFDGRGSIVDRLR